MRDRTLYHHAERHWPYLYHYQTSTQGIRLTWLTHGGKKGETTDTGTGTLTFTGTVCIGVTVSVGRHAWCLRWAELNIRSEEA